MEGPNYTKGTSRFPVTTGVYDGSTLAGMRKTPTVLYGIFTEVVRSFYSEGVLGDKYPIWSIDENTTGIWIDQEQIWEDKSPQFRPAIYVSLGPMKITNDVGNSTGISGMIMEEGEYKFQQRVTGEVAFTHIGTTRSESLVLCESTMELLSAFCMPIRDEFCFDKLSVVGFNPTTVDKEAREVFSSRVGMSFTFQETWTLKQESAKLKKIVFDIGQQSANLVSMGIL